MVTTPSCNNMQFLIVLNTPLGRTGYNREYEHILNTAVTNGFDKN